MTCVTSITCVNVLHDALRRATQLQCAHFCVSSCTPNASACDISWAFSVVCCGVMCCSLLQFQRNMLQHFAAAHSARHPCSFTRFTWLVYTCDMTHERVWHDAFRCVPWLIHMFDMTHSNVWYYSLTHVKSLLAPEWAAVDSTRTISAIYVCAYIYISQYMYSYIYIHIFFCTYTLTNINMYIYAYIRIRRHTWVSSYRYLLFIKTATHCNTLQHTAAHCNTLQHTAAHCNTLQHTAAHCSILQHSATQCNTLQHTAHLSKQLPARCKHARNQ